MSGIIAWKACRGWDVFYYTDGMRHGETTEAEKATKVSENRFYDLREKKLVPKDAKFQKKG